MSQQQETAQETASGATEEPAASATAERAAQLFALIEAEFGDRLDEAGRARVRERIDQQLTASAQLSAAAATLDNGEEPDFVFSPYREQ